MARFTCNATTKPHATSTNIKQTITSSGICRENIYNLGQNIWNKIEKSSETGQEKKSLISTLASFLTAVAKVYFLEGGLGTRLCLHPNFEIFLIFPYFQRSQVLSRSATREAIRMPNLLY